MRAEEWPYWISGASPEPMSFLLWAVGGRRSSLSGLALRAQCCIQVVPAVFSPRSSPAPAAVSTTCACAGGTGRLLGCPRPVLSMAAASTRMGDEDTGYLGAALMFVRGGSRGRSQGLKAQLPVLPTLSLLGKARHFSEPQPPSL